MLKNITNQEKFELIVRHARNKHMDIKTDVDFIRRCVANKYPKAINDIYEALETLDKPPDEWGVLYTQADLTNSIDLAPFFLQEAWGLFSINARYDAPQHRALKNILISRSTTILQMFCTLGDNIIKDKRHNKNPESFKKYFKTLKTLAESKHLSFNIFTEANLSETNSAIELIDCLLLSDIFKKNCPTPELNITQYNIKELFRSKAYEFLKSVCKVPVPSLHSWDHYEAKIAKDWSEHVNLIDNLKEVFKNDIEALYVNIQKTSIARTAHERLVLEQEFLHGFVDIIKENEILGFDHGIDLLIHVFLIDFILTVYAHRQDSLTLTDLNSILTYRDKYKIKYESRVFESLSLDALIKITAKKYVTQMLFAIGAVPFLFIPGLIVRNIDDDSNYQSASDFLGSTAWVLSISSILYIMNNVFEDAVGLKSHKILFDNHEWTEKFKSDYEDISHTRELRNAAQYKEHLTFLKALDTFEKDLHEAPNKLKIEQQAQKDMDTLIAERRKEEEKERLAQIEAKRLERLRQQKQEEEALKEEKRRRHEGGNSKKPKEKWKPKEPSVQVIIAPPVLEPVIVPPPRPALMIAPVQEQPEHAPLQPIVVFALGDKKRDKFVEHVKHIMNTFSSYTVDPQAGNTPESLAALSFDLLCVLERMIDIKSNHQNGCGQRGFIETLIGVDNTNAIDAIRNGMVHNHRSLIEPEKQVLYQSLMNSMSIISTLHTKGNEIQPNGICRQALERPQQFPVAFNLDNRLGDMLTRLTAPHDKYIIDRQFINELNELEGYLQHVIELYINEGDLSQIEHLRKAFLMTVAQLGEIYKEIYVNQKCSLAFERALLDANPDNEINQGMVNRFINARRDIVHNMNVNEGDVGAIFSSRGSILKPSFGSGQRSKPM